MAILDILNSDKENKVGKIEQDVCNGNFGFSKTLDGDIASARFRPFLNKYPKYKSIATCVKTDVLADHKVAKKYNINMQNKMFNLDGTDDIAFLNLFADINMNQGKPMGLTAGMGSTTREMKYIKKCIKDFNNGNFNMMIYNSEFKEY